jgi:PKHD-type hydroxylase|tara:strand:+ start:1955 stop:2620 length:666 start_codon:yes stop_codon:yes gene_type:complete
MNLQHNYWYFKSVLSKDFCENIIKYGNQQKDELALTGGLSRKNKKFDRDLKKYPLSEEEQKDLKKKRNSHIVWLNDRWIYDTIHPYIHTANESAGWNFQWDWTESCQFTKYNKGQFYGWHQDSWDAPYDNTTDNPDFIGKTRKLSVTVSLSDPKDYKGGELEFAYLNAFKNEPHANKVKCTQILPQGSIVVFPSFHWHRVNPVTEGHRYSLVMWQLGLPYK